MPNPPLPTNSLDFEGIKTNFREYLKSQSRFADYNFEGSNLSVLMNLLAYNTYLNNFYLNMVAGESFLDSAQTRNAVLAHSKLLNYLPRSRRSASARINLVITTTNNPRFITIPKYTTQFTTRVDNNTFTFTTNENKLVQSANNTFVVDNVDIYEGLIITEYYTVNDAINNQRFIFSNPHVDTTSVEIVVQNSVDDLNSSVYFEASSILGLDNESNVFFIQPANDEHHEIVFGDNVIGNKPMHGNVIRATYRCPSGDGANRAATFSLAGSIAGYNDVDVVTVRPSDGGAEAESIDKIKFFAPRSITIQERAITTGDYETLLMQNFPEIESISIFGGEELSPPKFGTVLISVDTFGIDGISQEKIVQYNEYLKSRTPLSIKTEIMSPDFLFLSLVATVKYNANKTEQSNEDIQTKAFNSIINFSIENINDFQSTLRSSQLAETINNADFTILSNEIEFLIYKLYVPDPDVIVSSKFEFNNPLKRDYSSQSEGIVSYLEPALTSSKFTYDNLTNCSFVDNGQGVIQIIVVANNETKIVVQHAGTIDYDNGTILLNGFKIENFSSGGIKLFGRPRSNDIVSTKNIILTLDPNDVSVVVIPELL